MTKEQIKLALSIARYSIWHLFGVCKLKIIGFNLLDVNGRKINYGWITIKDISNNRKFKILIENDTLTYLQQMKENEV